MSTTGNLPGDEGFNGTPRFKIVRLVGAGGMGVVYEAVDMEQQNRVALKTVRHVGADEMASLKREFRALQSIHHPNLIMLGELLEHDGRPFFTMEFVDGTDFLTYVRGSAAVGPASPDTPSTAKIAETRSGTSPGVSEFVLPGSVACDLGRLHHALAQLVQALVALHAEGKCHLDLKPSNVLVSREGRVVVLDFGLVRDVARRRRSGTLAGTAEFIAPEEIAGSFGAEADWYSVGVMLYLALSRRFPYAGPREELLTRKCSEDPIPLQTVVPSVPESLGRLCMDLLARDPDVRPKDVEILRRLGLEGAGTSSTLDSALGPVFVGRQPELHALDDAYREVRRGHTGAVLIVGESGVGKTALVRQFLDQLDDSDAAPLIFEGRCYERESVVYKGIDEVIDDLKSYFTSLELDDALRLLPPDLSLVASAFPALRTVEAVCVAERSEEQQDPKRVRPATEMRARMYAAFKRLLCNVAERRPVVLVVEDLHWADNDTTALLAELMAPPEPRGLQLVGTMRPRGDNAAKDRADPLEVLSNAHVVRLGRLSNVESQELVQRVAGRKSLGGLDVGKLVTEAEGHPMYLDALVRSRLGGQAQPDATGLQDVLWSRIAALEAAARHVLEAVVVAGVPVAQEIVMSAAAVDGAQLQRAMATLRGARLVSTSGARMSDSVEPYHDRVRQAVLAHFEPEQQRRWHGRLALALEASRRGDSELLATHWWESGDAERAVRYLLRAAEQAVGALAFDRAARLFHRAIDLSPQEEETLRPLRAKLGDALVNAGRCAEAAEAFMAAAKGANDAMRLYFQRRAAEQNMISGHTEQGLEQLRAVLSEVGLELPGTPARAVLSLLWHRAWLRLRGLRWTARDTTRISPRDLERLEIHRAVALGLSFVDNIRGAGFQARGLRLALRLGERTHVARAILLEAGYRATQGAKFRESINPLLAEGARIGEELGDAYLRAWATGVTGVCDYLSGRFREANASLGEAEAIWVGVPGAAWELNHLRFLWLLALRRMGRFRELGVLYDKYRRDAAIRGDRLAGTTFARAINQIWLARDQPDRGRAELEHSSWTSETGFLHLQNWYEIESRAELDMYDGTIARTREELRPLLASVGKSLLMRIQIVRTSFWFLCGRLILAESAKTDTDAELNKLVRRLESERVPYALVWAKLLRAGQIAQRGDPARAIELLRETVKLSEEHELLLCAAAARWRLGELLANDEGQALRTQATDWLTSEDVRDPRRMVAVVAPGFR
jgi:hypothetical protein